MSYFHLWIAELLLATLCLKQNIFLAMTELDVTVNGPNKKKKVKCALVQAPR